MWACLCPSVWHNIRVYKYKFRSHGDVAWSTVRIFRLQAMWFTLRMCVAYFWCVPNVHFNHKPIRSCVLYTNFSCIDIQNTFTYWSHEYSHKNDRLQWYRTILIMSSFHSIRHFVLPMKSDDKILCSIVSSHYVRCSTE